MSNVISMAQQTEIERVLVSGDLARLTPEQRVSYYNKTCETLGLNPLTRPFDYITLQGKMTLYARKDATEQLRKIHGVSIKISKAEAINGIFLVVAEATDKSGRADSSSGAVAFEGLKGDAMANAMMKAETKAKRRVTLSICGLGMLDETELETIPQEVTQKPEAKVVEQIKEAFPSAVVTDAQSLGDYIPTFGKYKGQAISNFETKELGDYCDYIERKAKEDRKPIQGQVAEFIRAVRGYCSESGYEV